MLTSGPDSVSDMSTQGGDSCEVLPAESVLPVSVKLPASLPAGQAKGYLQLLAGAVEAADAATALGEVVFELAERGAGDEALTVTLSVSEEGEISIEVTQVSTQLVVASLTVPASA